jgi:hypothetical protein
MARLKATKGMSLLWHNFEHKTGYPLYQFIIATKNFLTDLGNSIRDIDPS